MEMCRPGNVIDVRVERQCAVEDDTQTLNLGGGGHCVVVKSNQVKSNLFV